MLPIPTAEPMVARMKPVRPDYRSAVLFIGIAQAGARSRQSFGFESKDLRTVECSAGIKLVHYRHFCPLVEHGFGNLPRLYTRFANQHFGIGMGKNFLESWRRAERDDLGCGACGRDMNGV